MKYLILIVLIQCYFSTILKAQNANDTINTKEVFPDSLFRAKLFEIVDENNDDKIQWEEVWNTNKLDISVPLWSGKQEISSIIGIGIFNNLDTLICSGIDLIILDLTENKKIEYLDCRSNYSIESILLPSNSPITYLQCDNNEISNLNLQGQSKLEVLICFANWSLSSLDIRGTSLDMIDFVEVQELEICLDSQDQWDALTYKNTNSNFTLNYSCSTVTNFGYVDNFDKDEVIKVYNMSGQVITNPKPGEMVISFYKSGKIKKTITK